MTIVFYKYQGTGNDFIILDNRKKSLTLTKEDVKWLCDRKYGIGADGLMLLEEKQGYDFLMQYYNADGNLGSMCGNGGRCLVQFAFDRGIILPDYRFFASDGPHEAFIGEGGEVHLKMVDVKKIEQIGEDWLLDTGSPHYVTLTEDVKKVDVVGEGKAIRHNKKISTDGVNVNFVTETDKAAITIRTFERGVEDETLSCGTGTVATALVHSLKYNDVHEVSVTTLGGKLKVCFERVEKDSFRDIWLVGPATFVFKGEIELNG